MFDSLRSLSDCQILSGAEAIIVQDRKLTLGLLAHLHEIERRKLYLERGFSSMFDYCTSHLRLSEGSAMRRIKTARCLARFPELHGLLASGEVNLMSVVLISRVLKPENADGLIARIRGKSKREVEGIVAELEPRVVIPADRVRPVVVPVPPEPALPASPQFTATGDGKKSASAEVAKYEDRGAGETGTLRGAALASGTRPKLERRSVVEFTARDEFMAKVEQARALVWHQLPGATFEQLFELALDALIARRDPVARQGRREKRRLRGKVASTEAGKRYIPAPVRDQVFVRDGFRCPFIGAGGRRCAATVALQVDHVRPVARGGASTTENLRILCAAHNRLEAERLMGRSGPPERAHSR